MSSPGSPWWRIGRAALAFLIAWAVTGVLWVAFTQPWVSRMELGTGWGDTLALLLFEAGFAAIGWFLVVLPLVRFGDHDGWFFRPRPAPLVGALSGIAILLAEYAAFFRYPPWEVVGDLNDSNVTFQFILAAVFGATLWRTYTRATRRPDSP